MMSGKRAKLPLVGCALAMAALLGCKARLSSLSAEDDLNDPTLEPAYRAAMQRLNAPFSIGKTHLDPSTCLTTWLERTMSERYAGEQRSSAEGLNLWNLTQVAQTSNDSRAKVRKLALEIELAERQHMGDGGFDNPSFLARFQDLDGRVVLTYDLNVTSVPGLIRNLIILQRNFDYFGATSRRFEESYLSRIEAGTIHYQNCEDSRPASLDAGRRAQIRSRGPQTDVKRIDYLFNEMIGKQRLRHFAWQQRFSDTPVPFIGSQVDLDPYYMPVPLAEETLKAGDLIQFGRRQGGELLVEATKIGLSSVTSLASWPQKTGLEPIVIGTFTGESGPQLMAALNRAIAKAAAEKTANTSQIQDLIDTRVANGEDLSRQDIAQLKRQNRRYSEIVIKNMRIIDNGYADLVYSSLRLPYTPDRRR